MWPFMFWSSLLAFYCLTSNFVILKMVMWHGVLIFKCWYFKRFNVCTYISMLKKVKQYPYEWSTGVIKLNATKLVCDFSMTSSSKPCIGNVKFSHATLFSSFYMAASARNWVWNRRKLIKTSCHLSSGGTCLRMMIRNKQFFLTDLWMVQKQL